MITIVPNSRSAATLPASPEQAKRLFAELRVVTTEFDTHLDMAVWTFAGGIVLMFDHTSEPPRFIVALDAPNG